VRTYSRRRSGWRHHLSNISSINPGCQSNHISNNAIGIWLSKAVTAAGLKTNAFTNVTTPISAGH